MSCSFSTTAPLKSGSAKPDDKVEVDAMVSLALCTLPPLPTSGKALPLSPRSRSFAAKAAACTAVWLGRLALHTVYTWTLGDAPPTARIFALFTIAEVCTLRALPSWLKMAAPSSTLLSTSTMWMLSAAPLANVLITSLSERDTPPAAAGRDTAASLRAMLSVDDSLCRAIRLRARVSSPEPCDDLSAEPAELDLGGMLRARVRRGMPSSDSSGDVRGPYVNLRLPIAEPNVKRA